MALKLNVEVLADWGHPSERFGQADKAIFSEFFINLWSSNGIEVDDALAIAEKVDA